MQMSIKIQERPQVKRFRRSKQRQVKAQAWARTVARTIKERANDIFLTGRERWA